MADDSLTYLLQVRDRRAGSNRVARNAALVAVGINVVLGLFILLVMKVEPGQFLRGMLALSMLTLLPLNCFYAFGLPLGQLQKDAATHASLLGGRCYDEVLGTRVTPHSIMRQIAAYSAGRAFRTATPWVVGTSLCLCLGYPAQSSEIGMWTLLWLVFLVPAVWASSFVAQQFTIFEFQTRSGGLTSLVTSVAQLLSAVPVLILAGMVILLPSWPAKLVCYLAYVTLAPLLSGAVARQGLVQLPRLREKATSASRRWLGWKRNRWIVQWSNNPIARRERQREAGQVPFGLLGAIVYQFPLAMLVLLITPAFAPFNVRPTDAEIGFYTVLVLVCALELTIVARLASGAVVGEVEGKTLDALQNTCLHPHEFARGWIETVAGPRLLENAGMAVMLGLLAWQAKLGMLAYLVGCAFLVVIPLFAAAVGLCASCASNRAQSARRLSEASGLTMGIWFAICCAHQSFASALFARDWQVLLLSYMTLVGLFCYHKVLRRLDANRT